MRWLAVALATLFILIQYPLWIGKGGWVRVSELESQVAQQTEKNDQLKARNQTLRAEVIDLKTGSEAIEERARAELGMIKNDEIFVQVIEAPKAVK